MIRTPQQHCRRFDLRAAISLVAVMAGLLLLPNCVRHRPRTQDSQVDIVGGSKTTGHPAVLAIYVEIMARPAQFLCTGTLVAPKVILTAAHCLNNNKFRARHVFRVFSGDDLQDPSARSKPILVDNVAYPEQFDRTKPNLGSDIGLIFLKEPLDIKPIPYRKRPLTPDMVGKKVRIVGYGNDSRLFATGSEVKREASVKIESVDDKFVKVGGFFKNVYRGDSGGPILMDIDGVETVVGVNSYSNQGGYVSSTATRVDAYAASFIDRLIGQ